jgi:hypothetical protein
MECVTIWSSWDNEEEVAHAAFLEFAPLLSRRRFFSKRTCCLSRAQIPV